MSTLAPPTEDLVTPRKRVSSVNRKHTNMEKWRRTHTWMPTPEQDLSPAPEWAATVGAQRFREGGHGKLCSSISSGRLGPVLVERATRFAPRTPVYAISFELWGQVCDLYPDLRPDSKKIGEIYSAQEYRSANYLTSMFESAFRKGVHSFVQSWDRRDPWYVAFVPRMWFEEVYRRLKRDGRLHLVG